MNLCYLTILLQLVTPSITAKQTYTGRGIDNYVLTNAAAASQPSSVVRQLYKQIVVRRPLGIPKDADKATLWPFFSKRLIGQLEEARACEDDYHRQYANDKGKPEFGWLELGLFSGADEMALPSAVVVERTESKKNGAFHVYVRFTYKESFETHGQVPDPAAMFHWRGAVIVKFEDGRFVVDDVLLFRRASTKIQSQLSHVFVGCDGPRWVGYSKEKAK